MPRKSHKRGVKGSRNHKEEKSTLCTDSHKSYIKFAHNLGIELQQVKRGKHKKESLYSFAMV